MGEKQRRPTNALESQLHFPSCLHGARAPAKSSPRLRPGTSGCLCPQLSHMLTIKLRDKRSPSPRTKRGRCSLVTGQLLALGAGLLVELPAAPKLEAICSEGHAGPICRGDGEARKPLASLSRLSQNLRCTCSGSALSPARFLLLCRRVLRRFM